MSRLPPISHRELVQRMRRLGWDGPFSGGKHLKMEKDDLTITLPNPHSEDIGTPLPREILRQAQISLEEWNGG
ncbi:MAG: type II toxin-antitoxin system HicA family toxin [Acidobacteriaceae bacterium]|nr:type II toxin-antitoxin system HicA family toxin [Acidobacteriaceae bacterium]